MRGTKAKKLRKQINNKATYNSDEREYENRVNKYSKGKTIYCITSARTEYKKLKK